MRQHSLEEQKQSYESPLMLTEQAVDVCKGIESGKIDKAEGVLKAESLVYQAYTAINNGNYPSDAGYMEDVAKNQTQINSFIQSGCTDYSKAKTKEGYIKDGSSNEGIIEGGLNHMTKLIVTKCQKEAVACKQAEKTMSQKESGQSKLGLLIQKASDSYNQTQENIQDGYER